MHFVGLSCTILLQYHGTTTIQNTHKHKLHLSLILLFVNSFSTANSCFYQTSCFSFTNSHCTYVCSASNWCISVSAIGTDWERKENCRILVLKLTGMRQRSEKETDLILREKFSDIYAINKLLCIGMEEGLTAGQFSR